MQTKEISASLQNFLDTVRDFATKFGLKLLVALLIVIIGFKLVNFFAAKISKGKIYNAMDPTARTFSKSFVTTLIKLLLVVTAAAVLGVPMASMVALIGSAGLAVGLALQGSLSNIAGGFILLVMKPFVVGDFICMDSISGKVVSISIFFTKLETLDGKHVIIPNSTVSNSTLTNITHQPTRRVDLVYDVAYSSDVEQVKRVLTQVADRNDKVLKDPAPTIRLGAYADSSLKFNCFVWCKNEDYFAVMFDMNEQVKKAFDENGIQFPFPQLDVHLDK